MGYFLADVALLFITLLALAVLSMVVVLGRAGYPIAIPQVVVFATLFALSLGLLISYLKSWQMRSD